MLPRTKLNNSKITFQKCFTRVVISGFGNHSAVLYNLVPILFFFWLGGGVLRRQGNQTRVLRSPPPPSLEFLRLFFSNGSSRAPFQQINMSRDCVGPAGGCTGKVPSSRDPLLDLIRFSVS
jgi:hypothetical protein